MTAKNFYAIYIAVILLMLTAIASFIYRESHPESSHLRWFHILLITVVLACVVYLDFRLDELRDHVFQEGFPHAEHS